MHAPKNRRHSGDIDEASWSKETFPVLLSWERRERTTVSTAQRCNPTLGTPAMPMGAGGYRGPGGGQGVPARPGGGTGSSLQPQEEPQGPGAGVGGLGGLVIPAGYPAQTRTEQW